MDGVEEGALSIRKRCFREVWREGEAGEAGGDGTGFADVDRATGTERAAGVECTSVLGRMLLLLILRRCRDVFSSGLGGKLLEGGGFGTDRDILMAR